MNPNVVVKIDALDNSKEAFRTLSKNIEATGKATLSIREKMNEIQPAIKRTTQIATIAFSAISAAVIKSGYEINSANSILIKATGASGKVLESMLQSARDISKFVPNSITEIAEVMGELNTRLGVTDDVLSLLTNEFLDFARITGMDGTVAVKNITRMMQDWNIEVGDSYLLLDQLAKAAQMSGVSVEKLTETSVNYGVQLRALGFSQIESIALLSKFEKEGVSTEKMVGGLSIALGKLAAEGIDDTAEGFAELIKRIKSTETVGEATRVAMEMLGARAGPDFALAVLEGRFAIEDYIEALEGAEGTMRATADASLTAAQQIQMVKNNIMNAIAPTAEMQAKFAELTNRILDFVRNNPELIRQIAYITAGLAGLLAVLGTVSLALLAISPISVMIVAAIAAIVLIVYSLKKAIEMFGPLWAATWEQVKSAASEAWDWIKIKAIDPMIAAFDKILRTIERVRDGIASIGGKVGSGFSGVTSSIGNFFGKVTPFADGGIVTRPTLGLVGEAGPEAIIPLSRSAGLAGMGGITVNISGNSFMGERDMAERVGDQIIRLIKQNQRL